MQPNKLTKDNFIIYASKNYQTPQVITMSDFQDDLKRIKYIKRLINRFKKTGDIKERLVLNHIIILCNMFSPQHATKMLFFKLEEPCWGILKSFLTHLNILPRQLIGISDSIIFTDEIPINMDIVEKLKKA